MILSAFAQGLRVWCTLPYIPCPVHSGYTTTLLHADWCTWEGVPGQGSQNRALGSGNPSDSDKSDESDESGDYFRGSSRNRARVAQEARARTDEGLDSRRVTTP